jgi:hypothetical protein
MAGLKSASVKLFLSSGGTWFSVPAVRLPGPVGRQAARGKLPGTEVAKPRHVVLQRAAACSSARSALPGCRGLTGRCWLRWPGC